MNVPSFPLLIETLTEPIFHLEVAQNNLPRYAGVGSRKTPEEVLVLITTLASFLTVKGFVLRSGGAVGADLAFEMGCDKVLSSRKEIYKVKDVTSKALALTEELLGKEHWNNCNEHARKLHSRNVQLVLGLELETPVKFIVCWTDQLNAGGTRTSIILAEKYKIPVFNLYEQKSFDEINSFVSNNIESNN